jgi:hypothetical protein
MLKSTYPEHEWLPWKFRSAPKNLWNQATQRLFWIWLAEQKAFPSFEQWYALNVSIVRESGGARLLELFHNSLPTAVAHAFPEHPWDATRFDYTELNYWGRISRQRELFENVMLRLNLRDLDSWYSITTPPLVSSNKAVRTVLDLYGGSLSAALESIFPDHPWQPWKFRKLRHRYWDAIQITSEPFRKYMLDYLGRDTLRIETLDDWYRVSTQQLRLVSAHGVIIKFGGLFHILRSLVPEHPWEKEKFSSKSKKSAQWLLKNHLRQLFPEEPLSEEVLPDPGGLSQRANFDIIIPALNLAFEYQGAHHFRDVLKYGDARQKDATEFSKAAYCQRAGLLLIAIPYWWDGHRDSLANTIRILRPDIFPSPLGFGREIPRTEITLQEIRKR